MSEIEKVCEERTEMDVRKSNLMNRRTLEMYDQLEMRLLSREDSGLVRQFMYLGSAIESLLSG